MSPPAAEIIIGNSVIADVSVQSGNLLVITGKSFGITNMIALDAKRQVIFERRILVKRDEVRVETAAGRQGAPDLQLHAAVQPDGHRRRRQGILRSIMKAAEKKSSMSEKAADMPGGGQ